MESTFILRDGKIQRANEVWKAWTSGDLQKMLLVINSPCNKTDRHFLLQNIVKETFKLRANPKMRSLCLNTARTHVKEFPEIAPHLKNNIGAMPRISSFEHLISLLVEDGEYQEAIEVCKMALSFGVGDRTKGGYQGRMDRLVKKQLKLAK